MAREPNTQAHNSKLPDKKALASPMSSRRRHLEDDVTHSGRAKKRQPGDDDLERSRKISEMIRYFLMIGDRKMPIRRTDLITATLGDSRVQLGDILKPAKRKLKKMFGIRVEELSTRSSKFFVLINNLDPDQRKEIIPTPLEDSCHRALLFVVLTLIYTKNKKITEDQLWYVLRRLGVEKSQRHPVFGAKPEKLIESTFVKQLYLNCYKEKHPDSGDVSLFFTWGARADLEFKPDTILNFVAQEYGGDVDQWKSQYEIQENGTH
ncbi:non-structural maintenance of chromosomes element 3 homolog [Oscarella lobularis]|uniref:non-structural maintenance of chromosomes element 3 homolog n=1 Tax=Oscarella lobularis TaxID=121494 RepID=UPI0033130A37